jgi:molybdate transport system ATP-binding protein
MASGPQASTLDVEVRHRQGDFRLDVRWSGDCRLLGLFGPSGSGKTSLLEVLAGLRRPTAARVSLNGGVLVDTAAGVHVAVRHRGIGYVPQDSALFPHLSVRGNILYGATRGPAVPLDPVLAMLEIEVLIDRRIAGLSGGERQRVALARALVSSPVLLLLDEPLSAVDVPLRRRILEALGRRVSADGVPTVHVSHDAADLRVAADRVLFLNDGRITREGDAGDLPV